MIAVRPVVRLVTGLTAVALCALPALPAAGATAPGTGPAAAAGPVRQSAAGAGLEARGEAVARHSERLSAALQRALTGAGFIDLVDFGPVEGRCPAGGGCPTGAPSVEHVPTVDAAVVELDRDGRVTAVANVVLDRAAPDGHVVEVGADLAGRSVRWHRWDDARWNGDTPWTAPWPRGDLLAPATGSARLDVMSPYPGSLFSVVVAVATLRLADAGGLDLDEPYRYALTGPRSCLDETFTATATTRDLLDRALASSDHAATCMLLAQLHERDQVRPMNDWLRAVGLGTIRVEGTDPGTGGRWQPGRITMTALDTARLLLLVRGAAGDLWPGSDGRPVRSADVLSAGSRALLLRLLGEQGFNEALSTANWCGRADLPTGIPHAVPARWLDPLHGTVTVGGVPYGQDVRPCNAAAEVSFAHKTATTYTFGADAGIVDSLPGKRDRHYVVAVLGTLGSRYADARYAYSPTMPCDTDVCFTAALGRLGAAVDAAVGATVPPGPQQGQSAAPSAAGAGPLPATSGPAASTGPSAAAPSGSPAPRTPVAVPSAAVDPELRPGR